jgi:hypothetical protein
MTLDDIRFFPPRSTGPAVAVHPGRSLRMELYVTASVAEVLLGQGRDARYISTERRIGPGCTPDLVSEPPEGPIEVWESKRDRPGRSGREQCERYVYAAWDRWPGREVHVYLVWPTEPQEFPWRSADLTYEEVAW